jgi:hypothetical protein
VKVVELGVLYFANHDNGLELNPDYGLVTGQQGARYVSLVARIEF